MHASHRNEKISADQQSDSRTAIPGVSAEMPVVKREMSAVTGAKLNDTDEISTDSRETSARRDEMAVVTSATLTINGEIPAAGGETSPVNAAGIIDSHDASAVTRATGSVRFEMFIVN
jgi:hypothetical protein